MPRWAVWGVEISRDNESASDWQPSRSDGCGAMWLMQSRGRSSESICEPQVWQITCPICGPTLCSITGFNVTTLLNRIGVWFDSTPIPLSIFADWRYMFENELLIWKKTFLWADWASSRPDRRAPLLHQLIWFLLMWIWSFRMRPPEYQSTFQTDKTLSLSHSPYYNISPRKFSSVFPSALHNFFFLDGFVIFHTTQIKLLLAFSDLSEAAFSQVFSLCSHSTTWSDLSFVNISQDNLSHCHPGGPVSSIDLHNSSVIRPLPSDCNDDDESFVIDKLCKSSPQSLSTTKHWSQVVFYTQGKAGRGLYQPSKTNRCVSVL